MAKPTAKDLDAELAALEAELAALERKQAVAPAKEAEPARKFGLPKLGKKAAPASEPAPAAPAPTPAPAPAPSFDASKWRREENAWVRTVDTKPAVVRRILDENDNVVREEPATEEDVGSSTPAKAERGIGRFLRRRSK